MPDRVSLVVGVTFLLYADRAKLILGTIYISTDEMVYARLCEFLTNAITSYQDKCFTFVNHFYDAVPWQTLKSATLCNSGRSCIAY